MVKAVECVLWGWGSDGVVVVGTVGGWVYKRGEEGVEVGFVGWVLCVFLLSAASEDKGVCVGRERRNGERSEWDKEDEEW